MTLPEHTSGWMIQGTAPNDGSAALVWKQNLDLPKISEHDVLIQFHAWSLNYPEIAIATGTYPWKQDDPAGVPGSDAAGEVVYMGSGVKNLTIGDRVFPIYYPNFDFGSAPTVETGRGVCGLDAPGVFCEYAKEAATLPCSALTAWNALYGYNPIKPGSWVLVQGTGGVSMFAIQCSLAAEASVIATTSSEEKAALLREMGVKHIINYKEDHEWGETARKLTPGGLGCDHVIEVGGPATIHQSFQCVARGGVINVIGFLAGQTQGPEDPTFLEPLVRACVVRGVEVGSRQQLEDMIKAIECQDIKPVLDGIEFSLKELKQVYERVWKREHFGKAVITGI
ncbi:zinc-containing alcohol [Colletotrichum asianum]|uniref:Zinc-containing alcohol n=1 Tax=Colletotrichum asianum TaxID=702518 RepID=A0A8H3WK57_9PEZI|nr:zinc-containing alcohol [Colletotrichum asianum]